MRAQCLSTSCLRHRLSVAARYNHGRNARIGQKPQGLRNQQEDGAVLLTEAEEMTGVMVQAAGKRWEHTGDAVRAYGVLAGILGLGAAPPLHHQLWADLPYFIGLAVTTIYIGAHRALTTKQRQQINLREGALAPLLASVALFGCYLIIKIFPDLDLQTILNIYFWVLGTVAIAGATVPVFRQCSGPLGQKSLVIHTPEGLLLDEEGEPVSQLQLAPSDLVAFVLSLVLATWQLGSGHSFTLNNLVACLITTEILQLIGIRSFRTASLMLLGLLVYDVFWVFGSPKVIGDNVMLAVATSDMVSGPTRLLFPRVSSTGEGASFPFSLLGLGDIAIPGLLACLTLRYDASRARMGPEADGQTQEKPQASLTTPDTSASTGPSVQTTATRGQAVSRPYFTPVLVAYITGLTLAFVANAVTDLGQPALLYIVPCTLLSIFLTAMYQGDVAGVWQFTDVPSFGALEKARHKLKEKP